MVKYKLQTELTWRPRWDCLAYMLRHLDSALLNGVQIVIREPIKPLGREITFNLYDQAVEDLSW